MSADPTPGGTIPEAKRRRIRERITVCLSPQDRQAIERRAEAMGMTPSDYLRACALEAPEVKARRRALPEKTLLARLFGQTRKAGGNLAQVLRAIHFGEPWLAEELRDAIAGLNQAGDAIREALGRK